MNIDPGVAVYGMFSSFNYKPWAAIAEFVDNSISSFLQNRQMLRRVDGPDSKLRVDVRFDDADGVIEIHDNAAGIDSEAYSRAFALGTPPSDRGYISQYGVGMKAAAFWFCNRWSVRTKAIGELVETFVVLDKLKIIKENLSVLPPPRTTPSGANEHYTHVRLERLEKSPRGPKTIGKIKTFLANMYRRFIASGDVEICWQGEPLNAWEPKVLVAPRWDDPKGDPMTWSRRISVRGPKGGVIKGRAYLLETMSRTHTALNLFWHDRLIRGNFEPHYRPAEIFGLPNSFEAGRLGVDLDIDEFLPTVDKQNFRFEDTGFTEEELVDEVKTALLKPEFPVLAQARRYRKPRLASDDFDDLKLPELPEDLADAGGETIRRPAPAAPCAPYPISSKKNDALWKSNFSVTVDGHPWEFELCVVNEAQDQSLVNVLQVPRSATRDVDEPERLRLTIGYEHPFMQRFWSSESREVILYMASAVCFAEIVAGRAGAKLPSLVRSNVDKMLGIIGQRKLLDSSGEIG